MHNILVAFATDRDLVIDYPAEPVGLVPPAWHLIDLTRPRRATVDEEPGPRKLDQLQADVPDDGGAS